MDEITNTLNVHFCPYDGLLEKVNKTEEDNTMPSNAGASEQALQHTTGKNTKIEDERSEIADEPNLQMCLSDEESSPPEKVNEIEGDNAITSNVRTPDKISSQISGNEAKDKDGRSADFEKAPLSNSCRQRLYDTQGEYGLHARLGRAINSSNNTLFLTATTVLSPNLSSEHATIDYRDNGANFSPGKDLSLDGKEDELEEATRYDTTKYDECDEMCHEEIWNFRIPSGNKMNISSDDLVEIGQMITPEPTCGQNQFDWVTKDWDDEPQSPKQVTDKNPRPSVTIGEGIAPDKDFLEDWDD